MAGITIRGDVCEHIAILKPFLGPVKDKLRLQAKWVLKGNKEFGKKIQEVKGFKVVAYSYGKNSVLQPDEFFMKYKCISSVVEDYEFFLKFSSFAENEIRSAAREYYAVLPNAKKGITKFLFVAYPVYYPMLFYFAPFKVEFESSEETFYVKAEIDEIPEFPEIVKSCIIPIIQDVIKDCIKEG